MYTMKYLNNYLLNLELFSQQSKWNGMIANRIVFDYGIESTIGVSIGFGMNEMQLG